MARFFNSHASLVLTVILTLTAVTVYCQDKCPAIIDWHYIGSVDIYNKPDGKIIHQMKNDTANEDLIHLDILRQTDSYFYVFMQMNTIRDTATGWIKKADYIGAYLKQESFPAMDLTIYKDKIISNTDKIVITKWKPVLLTIEKYADKWVFVSLKQNGKTYKGWIEAHKLCANSYTYCN